MESGGPVSRSSQEGYAVFRWIANVVRRRYRLLVLGWILLFLFALAGNSLWRVNDVITFSMPLPEDTPSAQAQKVLDEQFPGQTFGSTATVVIVAPDATTLEYRQFVADLHAAIVAASNLSAGETATFSLHNGASFTVDRPIEYMKDPSNATIYRVYTSTAYALARQFDGPVHDQVQLTQTAAGIYWGLPKYFLAVWSTNPGPLQNETAKAATESYVATTFPPTAAPWANGSFQSFYLGWNASWSNASMTFFPPNVRAETVIAQTLPAFLNSPLAMSMFPQEARDFQMGMLGTFNLTNFADPALVESYALAVFPPIGVASLPFFEDVLHNLTGSDPDPVLRQFADDFALRYDPLATPLIFPVNVARFFISGDRTLVLMNYQFAEDVRFVEDHRQPIKEDVAVIRDLVARMKAAYGLAATTYVTGSAPLGVDQEFALEGGAEFIATIGLVIILIGLYFRSALSPLFPILTIAIALMIANLFVYLVAVYLFDVHFTVTAVLQTVLLATGTDYSIFLISRYRDERRDGRDVKDAVQNAGIWAGESVATSGGAVLIAFAALSLSSFPILRGMGLAIGFGVTVALGLALTFIPAILVLLGDRVFWPSGKRVAKVRAPGERSRSERYFHGAASFAMNHAKAVVLAAVLVTIPATYIVLTDEPTFDLSEGVPATESGDGVKAIADAFGEGFLFPAYVVVQFPDPILLADGNVSVSKMDALHNLTAKLLADEPGVFTVEGPTNPQGTDVDYRNLSTMPPAERAGILAAMKPFIGRDNATVRLLLVFADPAFSRPAIETVDRLDGELTAIQASEPELARARIYLGGVSPILNDVRDSTNHDLALMAVVVTIGLFLVLLFVLGSVLIPFRAILTILLSIVWTLALTILVFRFLFGLDVLFFLPLALFVMVMGLGMDYDIFIITRVREEVARGKSDRDAIREAVTRTGGIITACGIVMAGAFATLTLSKLPFLKEIGFALAFAIILDSSVVRIYLVPAIMVLAGKYNWWAPGRLQRVRRGEKTRTAKDE